MKYAPVTNGGLLPRYHKQSQKFRALMKRRDALTTENLRAFCRASNAPTGSGNRLAGQERRVGNV